jgi:transcription antitermination factor NusG
MTHSQKVADNDATPPKWFIIRSRPGMEARAGEEILSLGQTVYVPRYRKEFKHARKNYWTTRYYPLMTGYLFVMASDHWSRVIGCESVERILRTQFEGEAGPPIGIDDRTIREIRDRQEAGAFDEMRVHGRVPVGEQVSIATGALSGLKGPVAASDDNSVVMLIQMFGQEIKAKAPLAILKQTG